MAWVPIAAWIAAAAIALVVLGFCAYEITWKTKRLRGDLAEAKTDVARLQQLQAGLQQAQERIAAAGQR